MAIMSCSWGNSQDIAPQVWSHAYVGWNINEKMTLRNAVAYDVLLSKEFPWKEFIYTGALAYDLHKYFEASGGLSLILVKQSLNLSSFEVRLFAGIRFKTNIDKRLYFTNFTRLEWRNFKYSDGSKNSTGRFRNRAYLAFALTKKSMISDKNLFLLSYFEAFYNFNDVRERFFNALKYKLGLGYRLSYNWRFDLGLLYQGAKDNTGEPVHPITKIDTYFVLEWGVGYIIGKN